MASASIFVMILPLAVLYVFGTALFSLLQWLLCRLDSPWPGRILPLCSGAFSLLVAAVILSGRFIGRPYVLPAVLIALAVLNLPTLVYLLVYRAVRRGRVRKQDVEKMNIQDL